MQWSPKGSYVTTVHTRGVAVWGGPSFGRIQRFSHNQASHSLTQTFTAASPTIAPHLMEAFTAALSKIAWCTWAVQLSMSAACLMRMLTAALSVTAAHLMPSLTAALLTIAPHPMQVLTAALFNTAIGLGHMGSAAVYASSMSDADVDSCAVCHSSTSDDSVDSCPSYHSTLFGANIDSCTVQHSNRSAACRQCSCLCQQHV